METFYHALMHAVEDTLRVVPILFLAYLLVSYLSHDHNHKFSGFLSKHKKTSVLYASFLGCIPQCGFSSVIADLYSRQKVTLGTLVAVFVATSDEAIPLMIANPDSILSMLLLIGVKLVLALVWGYSIDLVVDLIKKARKKKKEEPQAENHEAHEHHEHHKIMHHIHECGHVHSDECEEDCHHKNGCCVDNIFLDAFKHTFEIMLYLFIFTFIMELILQTYSIDVFRTILTDNVYIQILIACVVGLIPNCASSVFLVELYMLEGVLSFPALVAGLSTGAGVGLFILISRNRKHPLKSLGIVALQFAIGVISGIVVNLFYMLAV